MCGISGIFHFATDEPVSEHALHAMDAIQKHRGPDDGGFHLETRVGLGNRRLAIVDRAMGRQPMSTRNRTLWITYNGEIFNHREIRGELVRRGIRFRTESDTEVVLEAYAAYGQDCLHRFNGQFAFAIWDGSEEELFVARDRMGIVPLHFAVSGGRFLFASEAKGLLEHPEIVREVDEDGLADVLLCGTALDRRTLFRHIESLPPGHWARVTRRGVAVHPYWKLPSELGANPPSEAECGETLMELLRDSVRLRLMGEVPIGTLLSGGIDSSTIATMASRARGERVPAFTIDASSQWRGEDTDASYAALVASELGLEHHQFVLDAESYFEDLARIVWHVERPFNKGAVTMYQLYREIGDLATVVLCGEGADELLGGYAGSRGLGLDQVERERSLPGVPWAPHWRTMTRLLSADVAARWRCEERQRVSLEGLLKEASTFDVMNQALFLYSRYFLLELLELHDRTGLAFGVEARPPFLDHRIVELLAPLPSSYKIQNGVGKAIFRDRLRGFLPDPIFERRKTHLPIPRDPPTMSRQIALTRDLVCDKRAKSARFFDRAKLEDFLDRRNGFEDVSFLALWQNSMVLVTLEELLRVYRL